MSAVDWDLLAEHLGGALAGTPEGERVAALVATDPAWAAAAAQLSQALDAVAADLRTVGPAPPMPEEVRTRLDAALLSAAPAGDATPGSIAAVPAGIPAPRPGNGRPPGHPATQATRPGPGRPGSRRRRRRRAWAGALAGVAGVVAFAAVGLSSAGLLGTGGADDSAGDAALAEHEAPADGGEPGPDAAGAPAPIAALPVMTASGNDYQPDSPAYGVPALVAPDAAGRPQAGGESRSAAGRPVPPLDRLWDDPAPCLAAVEADHSPPPVTVAQMDFARFQGAPAVIVWVTTGDGAGWVQVVGPDCGAPGAGTDEQYREQYREARD